MANFAIPKFPPSQSLNGLKLICFRKIASFTCKLLNAFSILVMSGRANTMRLKLEKDSKFAHNFVYGDVNSLDDDISFPFSDLGEQGWGRGQTENFF